MSFFFSWETGNGGESPHADALLLEGGDGFIILEGDDGFIEEE